MLILGMAIFACDLGMLVSPFWGLPSEAPDYQALASARARFNEQVRNNAVFRLELTEAEVTTLLHDHLTKVIAPFREVAIDVRGGGQEDPHIRFTAKFFDSDLAIRGRLDMAVDAGTIRTKFGNVHVGGIRLPDSVERALEDVISPYIDHALRENGAQIERVELAEDKLVIFGRQGADTRVASRPSMANLPSLAASASSAVIPPAERLGPGIVNGREAPGEPFYVALGDSLAANVGVSDARDGYVSRFHKQLQERDGVRYGLRNLGVSGETSGSLIHNGQLSAALEFIRSNDVRYITLDVGANDLLHCVVSEHCSAGLLASPCRVCVASALETYESNLQRILGELRRAAPRATILFLQTYNPFSLGLGSVQQESDRRLSELNALAARVAQAYDVLVADGFTPMRGNAAATTHILDVPPDIHPRAIGFDILAVALVSALPSPRRSVAHFTEASRTVGRYLEARRLAQ